MLYKSSYMAVNADNLLTEEETWAIKNMVLE